MIVFVLGLLLLAFLTGIGVGIALCRVDEVLDADEYYRGVSRGDW